MEADAGDSSEHAIDIVVGISNAELVEAGVPVVSDILEWVKDASSRLEIVDEPEIMKVDASSSDPSLRSTFLRFTSTNVHMNLWLSGPDFMGPFPRLCLADNRDADGLTIERTAVAFEKAVNELKNVL